jgi:hypothetical protein
VRRLKLADMIFPSVQNMRSVTTGIPVRGIRECQCRYEGPSYRHDKVQDQNVGRILSGHTEGDLPIFSFTQLPVGLIRERLSEWYGVQEQANEVSSWLTSSGVSVGKKTSSS